MSSVRIASIAAVLVFANVAAATPSARMTFSAARAEYKNTLRSHPQLRRFALKQRLTTLGIAAGVSGAPAWLVGLGGVAFNGCGDVSFAIASHAGVATAAVAFVGLTAGIYKFFTAQDRGATTAQGVKLGLIDPHDAARWQAAGVIDGSWRDAK